MASHKVGSREEWRAAREELLALEKERTRRGDELARQRQELPWVRIDKEYSFDTEHGAKTLAELFDGRSQLVVYHFMLGPAYDAGGCPVCSSIADAFDAAIPHLSARDVTFLVISRAPLEKCGPTSGAWAGASPGSHRREATSTSTSKRHTPRSSWRRFWRAMSRLPSPHWPPSAAPTSPATWPRGRG